MVANKHSAAPALATQGVRRHEAPVNILQSCVSTLVCVCMLTSISEQRMAHVGAQTQRHRQQSQHA